MLGVSTEQIAWLQQHNVIANKDSEIMPQPYRHKDGIAELEKRLFSKGDSNDNETT